MSKPSGLLETVINSQDNADVMVQTRDMIDHAKAAESRGGGPILRPFERGLEVVVRSKLRSHRL